MSDVLFIFPTDNAEYHLGIATLSAVLKREGFSVALLMIDFRHDQETIDAELLAKVQTEKPSLIAVSAMSFYWTMMDPWLHRMKGLSDAPIIVGGWQPTLAPDETIQHACVDYICLGEGEFAMLELVQSLKTGNDTTQIENIWTTTTGELKKNKLRSPIPDLDVLPTPDYDLFEFADVMKRHQMRVLGELGGPFQTASHMVGRGCAYQCTYCCNHAFQQAYGLSAKPFIRRRSVPVAMKDLEEIVTRYKPEWLELWDEDLTLDRQWLQNFSVEYPRSIGLPFSICAHPHNAQGDKFEILAKAGCRLVMMGIECGNEEYRKTYLRRNISNQKIRNAFALARENGIMTLSFNMFGLPFETADQIRETLSLNEQIEPDYFLIFVYNPLTGTKLATQAKDAGLLEGIKLSNYGYSGSGGGNIKGVDDDTFQQLHTEAIALQQRLDELRKQRYPENMNWGPSLPPGSEQLSQIQSLLGN